MNREDMQRQHGEARKAWKAMGQHPKAEAVRKDLRLITDGPLHEFGSADKTMYLVAQRDLALEILTLLSQDKEDADE